MQNTLGTTNPFPSTLQAGRIRYYTKLPDPSDTTLNSRFWATDTLPDLNERGQLASRVDTLRCGRDDIGGACGDVRAIAKRLTDEIERRFDTVFGTVCVHFQELFTELFDTDIDTINLDAAGRVADFRALVAQLLSKEQE